MSKLNQKALAKKLKVTPQYVSRLKTTGKIKADRSGFFSLREARAAIAAHARPGRVARQAKAQARKAGQASAARRGGYKPNLRAPRGSATQSLAAHRAEREKWEAEKSRLDVEEKLRKLLPAADVLDAERRKNANIRTRFRRLGRLVAPILATISDPGEIEERVLDEVDRLLGELAADPLDEAAADLAPADSSLQAFAKQLPVAGCQLPVAPATPAETEVIA